jgi:F-type H+-transporting ATPase subunit b
MTARAAMRLSRSAATAGLAVAGSAAFAGAALAASKMPQMNFADSLTLTQVIWMAAIMIAFYFLMARWALPRIGGVIETRKQRIASDLEAALAARREADRTVAELDRAIREAHEESRAVIDRTMAEAKDKARAEADMLHGRLETELARAKEEIEQTRREAVAVIRPVVEEVTRALVERLTGRPAERAAVDRAVDAIQR